MTNRSRSGLTGRSARLAALAAVAALAAPSCRRTGYGQDVALDRLLYIEVENPDDVPRAAANIAVPVSDLVRVARDFVPNCVTLYDGNDEVPMQADDTDLDGVADTLAFQVNVPAKGRKRLDLYYNVGRSIVTRYPPRARAGVYPELEGPGWESDAVGFRFTLDGRNAIGVLGKSEPAISLDRCAKDRGAVPQVRPWGMELLAVGETLGCGGFGFLKEGKIVRPVEAVRFPQIVADGPARSIVRVTLDRWKVDGAPRTVRATMTIWGGRRWAQCDLDVGPGWRPGVAVGLAASKAIPMAKKKEYFYTFGDQTAPMPDTLRPDPLGMAVFFKQDHFAAFLDEAPAADAAPDAGFSRAVILNPDASGRVKWRYLAAWGRGKLGIRDAASFEALCEAMLQDDAARLRVSYRSPSPAPSSAK
jgi:hypothetical protein